MNKIMMASGVAFLTLLAGEAHGRGFGGARGGTYVGPRGTTVQAGRVGGARAGPLGGVQAGGASGARVTTPTGRTYTTGQHGRVGVGPAGGVRATGGSSASFSGPYRSGATVNRGSVGVGPFGGVHAGGTRVSGVSGVRGTAVVGRSTHYVNSSTFRSQAAVVRTGGRYGYSCFTPTWYRTHTAVWAPARWATASYWVAPAWPAMVTWCGVGETPYYYDYGSTMVINNDYMYVNGEQSVTAQEYSEQATKIADTGRKAEPGKEDEWRALGVFGLVRGDEEVAQNIFQLAVNKSGVVRGNYYDSIADNTLPVYGSVDKKSQRVAWSIGDKKDIVFEAGLNNLTRNETTVLVHYGKDRTQQMALVRIEEPKEKK